MVVRSPGAAARGARPSIPRRVVHGVLLLDKGVGLSSNHALQRAKRLYRAEKAGHTGTLDPLASGLLPVAFGAAAKFAQASLDAGKRYHATLRLGVTTTTGDAEGELLRQRPVPAFDLATVEGACAALIGSIEQVPPMHSALKHGGRALYEYARRGIEVERTPRQVTVEWLRVVQMQHDELLIDVSCSKGTYVRVLAEDIGERLGCGAHLVALRRTGSGALDVADAITLDALQALDEAGRDARLLPADALLAGWPEVRLDAGDAARFLTGLRPRIDAADAPCVRVYGPQPRAFLGSAHVRAGELIADRLLSPLEAGALAAAST